MRMYDLNTFCRLCDLVYVEDLYKNHELVHTFLDFESNRKTFTPGEIRKILRENYCATSSNS